MCRFTWPDRQSFLVDPEVSLVGYQVDFRELMAGYFLFNHSCKTTLSIAAGEFADLYRGSIFEARATGTGECRELCMNKAELRPCPAKCECAYVREILRMVREWPKRSATSLSEA